MRFTISETFTPQCDDEMARPHLTCVFDSDKTGLGLIADGLEQFACTASFIQIAIKTAANSVNKEKLVNAANSGVSFTSHNGRFRYDITPLDRAPILKLKEVEYYRCWPAGNGDRGEWDTGHVIIPAGTTPDGLNAAIDKAVAALDWTGEPPMFVGFYADSDRPVVNIVSHQESDSHNGGDYRRWRFTGSYNSPTLSGDFVVEVEDGQYDYVEPLEGIEDEEDGDEPIQIAIGTYMDKHGINPGTVHR